MNTLVRPGKTFVDYAAVAICPALIMLLVGSVIFFLLAVGYAGTHAGELRWTFFWFVLAMVLVSRIAIERGTEHAAIYGLCLALATALMLSRYVDFAPGPYALLGLIWWATNKLTWDCTVIEDEEDASGEGLLQAAKLDAQEKAKEALGSDVDCRGRAEEARPSPDSRRGPKPPHVGPYKAKTGAKAAAKPPHAPGRWLLYFSLGALPTFGLGQGLIAREDGATRQYAFCLLVIYLTAALGLLLITSFLGLRRYLRQRYLQMPPAMSASWLTTGTAIASGVLIACLLLPRPGAYWTATAMLNRLGDPPSARHNQSTSSKGGEGGSAGQKAAEGGQAGPNNAAPPNQTAQGTPEDSGPKASTAPSRATPLPQPQLKLARLLIYAALLAWVVVFVSKHRAQFLRLLQEFWRGLLELFQGLFVRNAKPEPARSRVPARMRPRTPFASLRDPFATGAAGQMSLEDLVVASFQGLEAWAEQYECARHPDQTPYEFAERLAAQFPDLAHEANLVARLYVQVAYANVADLPASRTVLEILWSKMTEVR